MGRRAFLAKRPPVKGGPLHKKMCTLFPREGIRERNTRALEEVGISGTHRYALKAASTT